MLAALAIATKIDRQQGTIADHKKTGNRLPVVSMEAP